VETVKPFLVAMEILGSSIAKMTREHKSRYDAKSRPTQTVTIEIYVALSIFLNLNLSPVL